MNFKLLLLSLALAPALVAPAGEKQIQGVPYTTFAKSHGLPVKPLFEIPDTGTELPYDGEFTFDMIENWTGEGENRAALVIQWNDELDRDPAALVFGYRWDGFATGFDMLRDVVLNNPRLFALVQRTNVGCDISPIAPDGYTVDGLGWDDDESGEPGLYDSGNNDTYYPEGGLQYHPRGGSGIDGSYPDYDYDNWKATDDTDIWQAGWYIGYWSYWVKDSEADQFGYSGWGVACRELTDGSWDGWNYCPDMMPIEWKEFMAAPSNLPDDAVTEFTVNGLCYRLKNYKASTVTLSAPFDGTAYTDASLLTMPDGRHTIHSTFEHAGVTYTVVGIGKEAMVGAEITNIVIPATVTSVEAYAFAGSTVSEVAFPEGLSSIGESAFAGCPMLKSIALPAGVTEIPDNAFASTGLEGTLVIPSTVTGIMTSAFEGCEALTAVELPASVRTLMSKAFDGCKALRTVTIYNTDPLTVTDDLFDSSIYAAAKLVCPRGFADTYAAAPVWKNFTNISDDILLDVNVGDRFIFNNMPYVITSAADGEMTVKAKFHHFDGTHRDTAVELANARFSGNIVIPSEITYMEMKFRVTEISDSAFFRAKNLVSVTMPDDIKGFGKNMFDGCEKLISCSIPSNVTEISPSCFSSCYALKSIALPEGVTAIGSNAFYYCSALEQINLPAGLTSLGARAFYQCSRLAEVTLPAGVTVIPDYAFGYCSSLTHFEMSDNITSIGTYAFSNCIKLQSFRLPSALKTISGSVFRGCKNLAEIEIPAGVTSVQAYAFANCPADIKVYICNPDAMTSVVANSFRLNTSSSAVYATLTVPAGKSAQLLTKNYWKLSAIVEPEVTDIEHTLDDPVISADEVTLSCSLSPLYDGQLPERFAEAQNAALFPTLAVKAVYAPAESTVADNDAQQEAEAVVADGKATVTLSGLDAKRYDYRFVTSQGRDKEFMSEPGSFNLSFSGIEEVDSSAADSTVTYYDLQGRVAGINAPLAPGVYIKVTADAQNVTTEKVIVR